MYEILNITDFSHVSLFSYFCNPKRAGGVGEGGEGGCSKHMFPTKVAEALIFCYF